MSRFPKCHPQVRAARIRVQRFAPVALRAADHQPANGSLESLSQTGGSVRLAAALEAGSLVEVAVRVNYVAVRAVAEMLPVRSVRPGDQGCGQPFRFIAMADEDHRNLCRAIELLKAPTG